MQIIDLIKGYKYLIIIFLLFLLPRIVYLGWDEWNVDAQRWQIRSDNFVEAILEGNIAETYQSYHPGVTLMWLSGFGKFVFYKVFEAVYGYSVNIANGYVYPEKFPIVAFSAKFPLVLVISLLFAYSFNLLRRLKFDRNYLYIFAAFLSLEPFYLGISRFLHLTGLETAFVFAALTCTYYHLASNNSKAKHLYFSALFTSPGILTKMSTILIVPFIFGLIAFYSVNLKQLRDFSYLRKTLINLLTKYLTFILIIVATFILLFPASWLSPLDIIYKMRKDGIDNIAFKDGPHRSILQNKYLYYYEILFVKSLGLTMISFAAGIIILLRNKIKDKVFRNFLLMSLFYIFYYFFILAFPSKQMTRYTVIAYPYVIALSSYAVYVFFNWISNKSFNLKLSFIGLVALYYILILQAIFPIFSSFHSDLLGEYAGYSKIGKIYNDGEHYLQVGQYLNEIGGADAYDYALILPSDNKDVSAAYAFLGQTYVFSIKGDKKFKNVFIAPDYYSLDTVPANSNM